MLALTGYSDKLSARPGETIEFKVSSTLKKRYEAELVRVISADPNPAAGGLRYEVVKAEFAGTYASREQHVPMGSYARVDKTAPLADLKSFTLFATVWPTRPEKTEQGLIARADRKSGAGFALGIAPGTGAFAQIGKARAGVERVDAGEAVLERVWYHVWASFDAKTGSLTVGQAPIDDMGSAVVVEHKVKGNPRLDGKGPLLLAALGGAPLDGHLNGKLEAPRIYARALSDDEIAAIAAGKADDVKGLVAGWNFAWQVMGADIVDLGPHALGGRLVNCPARGVTGAEWHGREMCWRHAPEEYAAIHFHQDDLADCGWETDFSYTVPKGLKCGLYVVRLRCGEHEDMLPFYVCAPKGKPSADLCVIIPTYTYVIYANNARATWSDPAFAKEWHDRTAEWGGYPHNPGDHYDYALSTYNFHADGSGIGYSGWLRPMLTLRPGYITFAEPVGRGSGLRHLQADTHLTSWLEDKGYAFDIITDEELHRDGYEALQPYRCVLTCSHPEYHTAEMLDALTAYRDGGGRFCYLGGNGFYWKIAFHKDWPGVVEIRRGEGGIRAWAAEPGEYYNAFDGEYGGLWRRNGRPPQKLAGVGFTAQGIFEGSYYKKRPAAADARVSWMFKGLKDDKLGDFGFSGGGAAGFELDRADRRLGTPRHAVVVAQSDGHRPEAWILVHEEQLTHIMTVPREPAKQLIRADMTFFETPNNGAVFSVGSITFCGSLPCNGGDNNIAKLMTNVLDKFLDPKARFKVPAAKG